MTQTYFQKGFGLRSQVRPELEESYRSRLVDRVREQGSQLIIGDTSFFLAQEFGFCYGVERAVEYAYETLRKFPDRRIFLTGEIIHNPLVNQELAQRGIRFLPDAASEQDPLVRYRDIGSDDVVVVPAFGVPRADLKALEVTGCIVVDTTCGSVLNVWKNVERYSSIGVTSVIHGKHEHEETRATASQALTAPGGRYLVILNREEAQLVCDFIRDRVSADELTAALGSACSTGFDPVRDLQRVGLANQTTMLMSESLEIGDMVREAMADRYGAKALGSHYRAFETICSATQDRQDAVQVLLGSQAFDLAVVIGGYNSSNTRNLARMCSEQVPTFHIADASCLVSADEILHRPSTADAVPPPDGASAQVPCRDWFPKSGTVTVAVTAGASTPDSIVGDVISRLATCAERSA